MKLIDFFEDCLRLPYKPNSQDNPEHEDQVEELLKKHGLNYKSQPNGIQQSPDFRIFYESREIDVECKSSKEAKPMYNSGLPKRGVIYIFSSMKYNQTTIYFADDIVTDEKRELYEALTTEYKKILTEFQSKEGWNDSRGFDFYMRAMYTQSGSSHKTDYFVHSDRIECEQNVLNWCKTLSI
jgi:hypothetical protein